MIGNLFSTKIKFSCPVAARRAMNVSMKSQPANNFAKPQYIGAPRGAKMPAGGCPAREIVGTSPEATQTAGWRDPPAETLGKYVSRKGCSNLASRNVSEP